MERILIVDPDEEVLKDIQLILQTHKYKTSIFTSVENAISELPNFTPDLILSETRFDGLTGYDFLEYKLNNDAISNIPFVFVSLESSERKIRKAMNMGADDFLTKPFAAIDLLASIKARLHKYSSQKKRLNSSEYLSGDSKKVSNNIN